MNFRINCLDFVKGFGGLFVVNLFFSCLFKTLFLLSVFQSPGVAWRLAAISTVASAGSSPHHRAIGCGLQKPEGGGETTEKDGEKEVSPSLHAPLQRLEGRMMEGNGNSPYSLAAFSPSGLASAPAASESARRKLVWLKDRSDRKQAIEKPSQIN